MKNKSTIFIGILLASFLLANFAMAQTTIPVPVPGVCLNYPPGPYQTDPNSSPAACATAGGQWQASLSATITPAILKAAQATPQACMTLRQTIQGIWPGQAKAIWAIDRSGPFVSNCLIVPGSYPDFLDAQLTQPTGQNANGLYSAAAYGIPPEFGNIQSTLAAGTGLSSTQIITAQNQGQNAVTAAQPVFVAVAWALEGIFGVLNGVLAGIAAMAGGIFTAAITPILNITTMPTIVSTGWTIVRDICNMFFILAFIVMALATILQLDEKYNYRRILPKLVLAALLVNFSQVIAVTIMSAVNFLAAVFWSGPNVNLSGLFKTMMNVANPTGDFGIVWSGNVSGVLAIVLGRFVFTLVTTVVFIALAGLFVIRLVGLYVLIIFSPIAFVSQILPATAEWSKKWWSTFLKYLIWAPVALFMLRLALLTVNTPSSQLNFSGGSGDSVFVFFILAAFMAAALIIAQQAGMVGSEMVVNGVKNGLGGLVKRTSGLAGRTYNDFMSHQYANAETRAKAKGREVGFGTKALFVALNPVAGSKAWNERSKEQQHIASGYAQATAREIFGGKIGTPYRANLAREEEMKYAKDYVNMSKEQKGIAAKNLQNENSHEAQVRRRALIRAAIEDNQLEDIMGSDHFVEKYTDADDDISRESTYRFLNDFLNAEHDRESGRFMTNDVNVVGAKAKRFDYTGMATIDSETGQIKRGFKESRNSAGERVMKTLKNGEKVQLYTDDAQAAYASGEIGKLDAMERAQLSPQNFTTIHVSTDPETGKRTQSFKFKADAYGIATSKQLDEGVRTNIGRTQGRTVNAFIPGRTIGNDTIEVDTPEQMQSIKEFFDTNPEHAKVLYAKKQGVDKPVEYADKNIKRVIVKFKNDTLITKNPDGSTHSTRVEPEIVLHP